MEIYKNIRSSDNENLSMANEIANKVICLPIYPKLEAKYQEEFIELLI